MYSPSPRVCPGRVLAEDTLFIAAATLLASFNISNALPLKGDKIAYTSGIIRSALYCLALLHSRLLPVVARKTLPVGSFHGKLLEYLYSILLESIDPFFRVAPYTQCIWT